MLGSPTQQATRRLEDGELGPSTICAAPRRGHYTMYKVTEDSFVRSLFVFLF